MFYQIRADILRFQQVEKNNTIRLFFESPGLKTLIIYRFGRWLRNLASNPLRWPLVLVLTPAYWLMTAYMRFDCDIILDQTAEIGPGLYIGHFGGIRLRNCRIGTHCTINQEVCLEPNVGEDDGPIIGNRVWIGAHARIQGSVQVGDGSTVGAGAFVTKDVAGNCLVLGNPARVVQRDYDNSNFI
jgi:serine O-acetyltransferase